MKNTKQKHSGEYLIYTRKSTDDADNQKNSIAYQRKQSLILSEKEKIPITDFTLDGFCKNGITPNYETPPSLLKPLQMT